MATAKLTQQQRDLVKGLLKGKTITQAALDAGYSENCPGQVGSTALRAIKAKMPELMDKLELTEDHLLIKCLKPALEAYETKFAQKDGIFTDEREVIAWGPRLTALDMAFNLRGSYAPKNQDALDPNHARMTIIMDIPRPDAHRDS